MIDDFRISFHLELILDLDSSVISTFTELIFWAFRLYKMLTWTLIVLTLFKISNFRKNRWEKQCVVMRERRFIWNCWKINNFLEDKTRLIELTSSQSFLEHFKQMLRKSWLMNESKSRDNCLNKILCIIRRDFTFASDDSWRSDLNFRTRILIKSLFKCLKILSQTLTLFFYCWHVQQTFSKSSLVSSHSKNVRSFRMIHHSCW